MFTVVKKQRNTAADVVQGRMLALILLSAILTRFWHVTQHKYTADALMMHVQVENAT